MIQDGRREEVVHPEKIIIVLKVFVYYCMDSEIRGRLCVKQLYRSLASSAMVVDW